MISVTSHDTENDARNIARPMAVVPMKKGHQWDAGLLSQVGAARQRLDEETKRHRAESGSWSGRSRSTGKMRMRK